MTPPSLRTTRIETHRLQLAPPRRSDFDGWAAIRRESRAEIEPLEPLWAYDALSINDWMRRLLAWHTGWKAGNAHVFLAHSKADGRVVAGVSLTHVRGWPTETGTIGYWMGTPYAGQGLMTEAVGAVAQWAFDALDLKRLEASTVPDNTPSRRVLEKVGFVEEGFARSYLEIGGRRRDHVLYGLVRP